MKNTLLLMTGMMISFAAFSQNYDYSTAWKKVEEYQLQRKPESAKKVLDEITKAAITENNGPQKLRVFGVMPDIIIQDSDRGQTNHIDYLLKEINSFSDPERQVGHLVIAHYIFNYYNDNQYLIRDRTSLSTTSPDDLKEWSPEDFEKAILFHIGKALDNFETLTVSVDDYKPLLNKYNDKGKKYRPYLIDVVVYHVMNLLQNPLLSAADFQLFQNAGQFYAPLKEFLTLKIPNEYSREKILNLYQKILNVHLEKNDYESLMHADILRLKYIQTLTNTVDHDSLYLSALEDLSGYYDFAGAKEIIALEKAEYLYRTSFQLETDNNVRRKEAYEIANQLVENNPKNTKAQNLINRITQKKYNVLNKQVYSSKESVEISLVSTNVDKLTYTIVRLSDDQNIFYRKSRDEIKTFLLNQNIVDEGNLKITTDEYFSEQQNIFNISNPGLGFYAIYFEQENDFYYSTFFISDLAYVTKQKGSLEVMVVNRVTGKPIEDALVTFYLNVYNRNTRTNQNKLLRSIQTDKEGKVIMPAQNLNGSLKFSVKKAKDKIFLDENYYIYDNPKSNYLRQSEAFILTDRSIYRPGQIVHFKAILLGYNNDVPEIETGQNVTVSLKDANNLELDSKTLTSNEFGSLASTFTLPSSGLTGIYSLVVTSGKYQGYHQIQVEEYRRPKFEVEINDTDDGYGLGDSVRIQGKAISFSTAPVTGGVVTYNIYRLERRWWWSYFRPSAGDEVLVSSGITETENDGRFQFDFVAFGDRDLHYIFRIEVDVLDQSGETRSAVKNLNISGKKFNLFTDQISILDLSDTSFLQYYVQNNSDQNIAMPTSYRMIKLKDPGYLISLPEVNQFGSQNNVSEILKKWEETGVVKSEYISSLERKIDLQGLEAGGYKIEIYAGKETFTKYVALSNRNKKAYPFVQALFVHQEDEMLQPGQKAKFIFGTPFNDLHIYVEEERKHDQTRGRWIKISNQKAVDFAVTEEDYGGFGIKYWTIKNNTIVSENSIISVPWNHKKLNINYQSFRDNLLPGEKEKWIIEIGGEDKDLIAAELCASLYDMSLDQYRNHDWKRTFYPTFRFSDNWRPIGFGSLSGRQLFHEWNQLNNGRITPVIYPDFDFFSKNYGAIMVRSRASGEMLNEMSGEPVPEAIQEESAMSMKNIEADSDPERQDGGMNESKQESILQIRKNLQETVFFMPQLKTDDEGNILIEFTMGEALTKWKLLLMAHDKELRFVFDQKEIVTKKDLMVIPYAPRFFRTGDQIYFSGKVTNLSDTTINGKVSLDFFNAVTGIKITDKLINDSSGKNFELKAGESKSVSFNLSIPDSFIEPVEYRMVASSGMFSDGESNTLPIVSNKIYVTETKAFTLNEGEHFTFSIADFIKSGETVSLGFDYTTHPIWTVVQALPTLSDSPHESTEQILNKYFAHAIGNKVLTSIPNIDHIISEWMRPESTALLSNLEKNTEFKSTSLENTPWVLDARKETQQKRALGQFLDKNTLEYKKEELVQKLISSQLNNGGFPWFKGGRPNVYITQYILENIFRMEDLKLIGADEFSDVINRALTFIDNEAKHRYNELVRLSKEGKINLDDDHIQPLDIHFLFTISMNDHSQKIMGDHASYYLSQAYKYWMNKSDLTRALIARIAYRNGKFDIVKTIIESFNERMLIHPELGAYWKTTTSYYWYQLPIESHASVMELYQEVDPKNKLIDKMQLWLLNNKRTNAWPTTKSTATAIFALLKSKDGRLDRWIANIGEPTIKINDEKWVGKSETGSGYVKEIWKGKDVADIHSFEVINNNNNVGWGGMYVNYLADIDEIDNHGDQMMAVTKSLYVKRIKNSKEVLEPVLGTNVQVGEKVISRIVIDTDRDMSFLHLKDMRASGLEPINVISNYKWKGGIGYYESTKDVATHFFIDYLPKGKYVFENELRVSHTGQFSNGITTLESMYAPEFSSHSSSTTIVVN